MISSCLSAGILLRKENRAGIIGLVAILLGLSPQGRALAAPVKAWEADEVIPTYLAAPPSPIPRFYSGRTYQGAKATFYPYPVQDKLTDVKTNRVYRMVYLENDYVRIGILPEIGGRIFSAVDKSNGYNFFYRQHVIKPALIGMLGAWISGGVEWNVPHHHRATSFMPVDYTTVTNADGSKTVWVGETELRHRMRWRVGLTLHPDRSSLELNCKVFNRTPFAHPMLFWINPAVHANEQYQVLFPPSTEWAVQHGKPEFASWPIARQVYGGADYRRGVDISWWKNHPSPVSFFAWNYEDDWFGGYDHGQQAGVVHWADHHVAPGKKFFEWGNGPEGEMWSQVLTDDDGPYLELMAGAWSDNQPDYSWIQPGETREWKHWWYPVRNLGGVKAATRDAAVNLEVANRVATISVNTTKEFKQAQVKVELLPTAGTAPATKVFFQASVDIGPARPFTTTVMMENDVPPENLRLVVIDDTRRELAAYQPQPRKNSPMPKRVERPKDPKDYASADELYFTGQRIEQLYSPSFEAEVYYEEMLRRDPGDYRGNTAIGILRCKQWRWAEAEKHLRAAVARATDHHIRPQDGEALYYLGLAVKEQDAYGDPLTRKKKMGEAAGFFHKAAWSPSWQAVSYLQLAGIAVGQFKHEVALDYINQSLLKNTRSPKALNLKSAILRKLGRYEDAAECAETARTIDPLDHWASFEGLLGNAKFREGERDHREIEAFRSIPDHEGLEMIVDYANAGFHREAAVVAYNLQMEKTNPLIHYYANYFQRDLVGREGRLEHAPVEMHANSSFPFQYEMAGVLRSSTFTNLDGMHLYHLGCLLYDNQPENAIKAWEESRRHDDQFALVHRNLGLAYAQHEKDIARAIASLEKAVELAPTEPRFFYELDVQYEAGGAPVDERLAALSGHHDAVTQRDDALTREIVVLLAAGQLDRAIEILTTHRFHNWEGSREIRDIYVDAMLLRGLAQLRAGRHDAALKDYQAAALFPANLEVGRPKRDSRAAQIDYSIGTAHEAVGDRNQAREFYTKAVEARDTGDFEAKYYQGMARQKLGQTAEAGPLFEAVLKRGLDQQAGESRDYFAKFGEKRSERVRKAEAHYLAGLGHLGLGRKAEAQTEFKKALELHPGHVWAAAHLAP